MLSEIKIFRDQGEKFFLSVLLTLNELQLIEQIPPLQSFFFDELDFFRELSCIECEERYRKCSFSSVTS